MQHFTRAVFQVAGQGGRRHRGRFGHRCRHRPPVRAASRHASWSSTSTKTPRGRTAAAILTMAAPPSRRSATSPSAGERRDVLRRGSQWRHGRLDILVNNAGIAHVGTIEQTSDGSRSPVSGEREGRVPRRPRRGADHAARRAAASSSTWRRSRRSSACRSGLRTRCRRAPC